MLMKDPILTKSALFGFNTAEQTSLVYICDGRIEKTFFWQAFQTTGLKVDNV